MNNKISVLPKICQLIFLIVSVLFLSIAMMMGNCASNFLKIAEATTSSITEFNDPKEGSGSYVILSYTVEDKEYETKVNEYKSSWYEGKKLGIWYDKDNPKRIRIQESLYLVSTIFSLQGVLFLFITLIIATYQQQLKYRQKKLITDGNQVFATIIGCPINKKIRISGRHPYRIEASYDDVFTKQIYYFQSHNIYHDPQNMLGMQVLVYMNPNNPKDYFMDLMGLKEKLDEKDINFLKNIRVEESRNY